MAIYNITIQKRMQCGQSKNYAQQYTRSKNQHSEIYKNRNSYKQLLQNTKTRQNSTTTVHLKLSAQKKMSDLANSNGGSGNNANNGNINGNNTNIGIGKEDKNDSNKSDGKAQNQLHSNLLNPTSSVHHNSHHNSHNNSHSQLQPLLSSTQNMHNLIQVTHTKLNSKMKLKVQPSSSSTTSTLPPSIPAPQDKSLRSMSSHEHLQLPHNPTLLNPSLNPSQNSVIFSSMSNIGVGLSSNKKKNKLVMINSINSQMPSSKKIKTYAENSLCFQKSRSISQSHNNSVVNLPHGVGIGAGSNSKYMSGIAHEAAYRSIKKQVENLGNDGVDRYKRKQRNSIGVQSATGIEIVTINSSMLGSKDGGLQEIYDRVKNILEQHRTKQKQWQQQRNYYKKTIQHLQKNLQQQRRQSSKKTHCLSYTQISKSKQKERERDRQNCYEKSVEKSKQKQKSKSKEKQKYVHIGHHSNYVSHFSSYGYANYGVQKHH